MYFYRVVPGGFLNNKESKMGVEGGSNGGPYLSRSKAANPLSQVAIILCVVRGPFLNCLLNIKR